MLTSESINKILRWDAATIKRSLREQTSVAVLALTLFLECHKSRPRRRVVSWLCERIPTLLCK